MQSLGHGRGTGEAEEAARSLWGFKCQTGSFLIQRAMGSHENVVPDVGPSSGIKSDPITLVSGGRQTKRLKGRQRSCLTDVAEVPKGEGRLLGRFLSLKDKKVFERQV